MDNSFMLSLHKYVHNIILKDNDIYAVQLP